MLRQIFKKIILGTKKTLIKIIENVFHGYITFHLRPKTFYNLNQQADSLKKYPQTAIIIQGPLLRDDKFTLNTIRIYKKIFKEYPIILTTWEDEDPDYLNELKNEGIEIVLNQKPDYPGISHINYQLVSTSNGIKRAKELGMDYVLKTRTDLRLYNPNSIEFLANMLKVFPAINDKQRKRIAIGSINTFKYRPYSASDMVMFGQIDDMTAYWGVAPDTRKTFPPSDLIGDWSRAKLCEVYLSANYLEHLGRTLEWTIADSWQMYADHFCVFDAQSLDIYWHKYSREREYRRLEYGIMKNDQELTFAEWLALYAGRENKKTVPETILHAKFTDAIKTEP